MADLMQLAEQWNYELWRRGNLAYTEQICADTYTDYTFPETDDGDILALQDAVSELRAAFPDLTAEIRDSFQDEDYVILRVFFQGTHADEYKGFLPTQQKIEWENIEILHFQDELLIERWAQSDLVELLEENDVDFGALQANAEHAAIIAQLSETPKRLRQILRAHVARPAPKGEWSVGALFGHLWRCEVDVWQHRLREMADKENPHWEYWDPEQYDWESEFGAADVLALLDAFEFRRAQTCSYLRALPDEGWLRRGEHRTFGVLDVAGLMNEALKHDREHLDSLSGAQI